MNNPKQFLSHQSFFANKDRELLNHGLALISVGVSLVLLEFLCGYLFDHLPEKFNNGKRIVQSFMGKSVTVPAQIESHPYLLYQNSKNYRAQGFLQHNFFRYRNPDFHFKKDPASVRILALGGSTTYMFPYVKNPNDAWPAQLQKRLQKETTRPVEVINAGQSYATSAELLSAYVFRHRYLKPDILIVHIGGNDIAALMFEHYDPEYTHFRAHGSGLNPRPWERRILRGSRFLRVVYALWLNEQETVYQSQPFGFRKLNPDEVFKRVTENPSEGFRRNLDALIRYAKVDGVQVVLFGFVQVREELISQKRPEFKGLEKSWSVGLAKHNKIMAELAVQYKIPFIKLDPTLFKDEWFQDNCHLNEEGEAMKASWVSAFLLNHREEYLSEK